MRLGRGSGHTACGAAQYRAAHFCRDIVRWHRRSRPAAAAQPRLGMQGFPPRPASMLMLSLMASMLCLPTAAAAPATVPPPPPYEVGLFSPPPANAPSCAYCCATSGARAIVYDVACNCVKKPRPDSPDPQCRLALVDATRPMALATRADRWAWTDHAAWYERVAALQARTRVPARPARRVTAIITSPLRLPACAVRPVSACCQHTGIQRHMMTAIN